MVEQHNEEGALGPMCMGTVITPVLDRVGDRLEPAQLHQLKSALQGADARFPGLLFDIVKAVVDKSGLQIKLQVRHNTFLSSAIHIVFINSPADNALPRSDYTYN